MPVFLLTATALTRTGTTPPAPEIQASTGGFSLPRADGRSWLEIKNADTVTHTITIVTPDTAPEGLAIADPTVTIPAGQTRLIGPFGTVFGVTPDLVFTTDVSVNSQLEIRAYRLPAV